MTTGVFDFEYTSFDGRGVLNTTQWIDDKGPRTVLLDSGSADMINGVVPVLLVAMAALVALAIFMHPIVPAVLLFGVFAKRVQLRAKFTAWLDAIESEMSLSAAGATEADSPDPY